MLLSMTCTDCGVAMSALAYYLDAAVGVLRVCFGELVWNNVHGLPDMERPGYQEGGGEEDCRALVRRVEIDTAID